MGYARGKTTAKSNDGSFKTSRHDEVSYSLAVVETAATEAIDRFERLRGSGYAPPITVGVQSDPRNRRLRERWWDASFVTAEYGHDGGSYRQMPDDWTPKRTGGRAMSGHRRTHRMCYSGAGVHVRMPSATSIKSFQRSHGETFDVPVSAVYDGGEVQGWVRVTKDGNQWAVSGLGFSEGADAQVAEAVSAVLEARHPRLALAETGDLLARRKARLEAHGSEPAPVNSTWIESVGYDPSSGTMFVETESGSTYGYAVDQGTYEAVVGASSPGAAYNRLVKGHQRSEVSRCTDCARFISADRPHECPVSHKPRGNVVSSHNMVAHSAARSVAPQTIFNLLRGRSAKSAPQPEPLPAPKVYRAGSGGHQVTTGPGDVDLAASLHTAGRKPVLDLTGGTGPLYGRRGWTTSLASPLAAHTGPSYVPQRYRSTPDGHEVAVATGPIYFSGVDGAAAAELYRNLPPRARGDRQNEGPAIGDVLDQVASYPDRYEFGGYVVGPDRTDERLTASSVFIYDDTDDEQAIVAEVMSQFDCDEPTFIGKVEIPWQPGATAWEAWWD